jgi:hypothetical protein
MTDPRIDSLFDTPEMLFRDFQLDPAPVLARFLPITELGYRASSHLDRRAVTQAQQGFELNLDDLLQSMHRATRPVRETHFILHVGHCGSTLISRLLGELPGHFALRDPMPLIRIAQAVMREGDPERAISRETAEKMMAVTIGLLGRTWSSDETAVVKPGYFAFSTYANLMRAHPDNRALLLDVPLEVFLATLLRPQQLDEQRKAVANLYLRPWSTIADEVLAVDDLSPGEVVAMMWLTHQIGLSAVAAAAPDRVMRLTFDEYLDDPAVRLQEITGFLGRTHPPELIQDLLASPLTGRYAKDTEHPYSPAVRDEALASSREMYTDEIRAGQVFAYGKMRDHAGLAVLEGRA